MQKFESDSWEGPVLVSYGSFFKRSHVDISSNRLSRSYVFWKLWDNVVLSLNNDHYNIYLISVRSRGRSWYWGAPAVSSISLVYRIPTDSVLRFSDFAVGDLKMWKWTSNLCVTFVHSIKWLVPSWLLKLKKWYNLKVIIQIDSILVID